MPRINEATATVINVESYLFVINLEVIGNVDVALQKCTH
jgi:hypothetical protein